MPDPNGTDQSLLLTGVRSFINGLTFNFRLYRRHSTAIDLALTAAGLASVVTALHTVNSALEAIMAVNPPGPN